MSIFGAQAQNFPEAISRIGPLAEALQWLNTHGIDGLISGEAHASLGPSGSGRPPPSPSPGPFEPDSRIPRGPAPMPPEPQQKSVFMW
jgi:hypothetical protein